MGSIPQDRTKSGREHRVPLSSGALKVLDQAKALGDRGMAWSSLVVGYGRLGTRRCRFRCGVSASGALPTA